MTRGADEVGAPEQLMAQHDRAAFGSGILPPQMRHKAYLDRCRAERDNRAMPRRTTQSSGESVPVGAAEIAARLGVRPQTVHTWRHRELMPEPRWTVSGQPAWDWREIEAWARRTGRLREGKVHASLLELEGVGWAGNLGELRNHRASRR